MFEAIIYVLAGIGLMQVIWACLPIEVSFWVLEKIKKYYEEKAKRP